MSRFTGIPRDRKHGSAGSQSALKRGEHLLVSSQRRGDLAVAVLLQGGSLEPVETYGHFTLSSVGNLIVKMGTRPPNFATALGLVAHHPTRTVLRSTTAASFDDPTRHDRFEPKRFVTLTRRQDKVHHLFFSRRLDMNFGAKSPLALAQGLGFSASWGTRRMLVSPNDRAIDIMNGPIHLARGVHLVLNALEQTLPDAGFAPAIEAAGHGAPGTIAVGQVAPGSAGAQKLPDTVEDASMVRSGPAGFGFLRRKQRLEPLPLRVG